MQRFIAEDVLQRGVMSTIRAVVRASSGECVPADRVLSTGMIEADIELGRYRLARLRVRVETPAADTEMYLHARGAYGAALVAVQQAARDITAWARQVLHGGDSPSAWRASVRRLPRTGLWSGDLHGPAGYHAHTVGAATAEDAVEWLTERALRVLNDPVAAAAIKIDVLDSAPVRAGVAAGE
ncbi:MAG: hypothetical protein Q3999_05170 [Buchananella hordeovulneris]|nr:hypothetical protein [Buchananella hordeovulneris]